MDYYWRCYFLLPLRRHFLLPIAMPSASNRNSCYYRVSSSVRSYSAARRYPALKRL